MSSSKISPNFSGLLPPQTVRPDTAFRGPAGQFSIIRDQFTISTWLCLGAVVQGISISLFGTISLLPAILFVVTNVLRTTFMTLGWSKNIYMDGVISKKFSAQFPDSSGHYSNKPADTDVVVFLIGTKVNHPLGLLAPGAKQIGGYFQSMEKALVKHEDEFGMLGMRVCLDAAERSTGSEIASALPHFEQVGESEFVEEYRVEIMCPGTVVRDAIWARALKRCVIAAQTRLVGLIETRLQNAPARGASLRSVPPRGPLVDEDG